MGEVKKTLLEVIAKGPGYGLSLVERVCAHTNGKMRLSSGSLYPALRALEREGKLESYEGVVEVPERGYRPRRYYRIPAPSMYRPSMAN